MTPAHSASVRFRSAVAWIAMPAACAALVWSAAAPAHAHLHLTEPQSRYGGDILKAAPCGKGGGERTDNVSVYAPGETIEIVWDEYIDHPSHYRVAFDDDGADDFEDPPCLENCDSRDMVVEEYTNDTVLLDGIEDPATSDHSIEVTLPNIECDNCTLQVIQVMYDKPPYEIGGNDLYYQCADLVLEGTPVDGGAPDAPSSGRDAGTDAATPGDDPIDSTDGGGTTDSRSSDSRGSAGDAGTGAAMRPLSADTGCSASGGTPSSGAWALVGAVAACAARRRRGRKR